MSLNSSILSSVFTLLLCPFTECIVSLSYFSLLSFPFGYFCNFQIFIIFFYFFCFKRMHNCLLNMCPMATVKFLSDDSSLLDGLKDSSLFYCCWYLLILFHSSCPFPSFLYDKLFCIASWVLLL